MSDLQVFVCGGNKCDHDWDGPTLYELTDGGVTFDRKEAEEKGCSGGGATCSKCGESFGNWILWNGP